MTTFNLADLWETLTDAGPDDECLVVGDRRHTRRSWDDAANRLASALVARGVGRGDMVAVYQRNRIEHLEALLACWKIGAVPVNVNWRYVPGELAHVLRDSGSVAALVDRGFLDVLAAAAPDAPDLRHVLVVDDGSDDGSDDVSPAIDADPYEAAVAEQSTDRPDPSGRSGDDLYLLYTGGTTGAPKAVLWRHEDIFYGGFRGGHALTPISAPEDIARHAEPDLPLRPFTLGPLMHGGAQWVVFLGVYSGGCSIVYTGRSLDVDDILGTIERERPTNASLVGDAMARPLAEAVLAEPGRHDVSSLLSIGSGGAPLSASVRAQLAEAFPGVLVVDGYGASETGQAGVQMGGSPDGGARFDVDERSAVLDPETLERCGPGERGLLARTGHIPLGYHNDSEKTAATFRTDADGVRWVLPGDWASIDEDGRVVLHGRGSATINTGGEKVHPEEVEEVLRSHPDVYDVAVAGVPDERWGERVVAIVQPRPGCAAPTVEAIHAHCEGHLARYKLPRSVLVDEIQRTPVGKLDHSWAKARAAALVDGAIA